MKIYVTHGTGSSQTLVEVQNTDVVVYNTKADAEADLSNLKEGQIVATKDSGDELAQPVNEVALNNLHSVTSNAVAEELALRLNTYEQPWGNPHSYSLTPDSTYILFCQNPNVFATDIWLIKSRHSTIPSLTGYCQIIMKGTYSPDYNIGIAGDTLTIDRECVTSLIKINLIYG